jgi:hypothetical protein
MKIVKIAMWRSGYGDDRHPYVYKTYWLKEDGIWYDMPGASYDYNEKWEALAKERSLEILTELPDDAVTDNPERDRAYLQRLRSTKIKVRPSIYASESDDIQVWEIDEKDLPRLRRMQGFLRGSPARHRKGYSVEILTGSEADRRIGR